MPDEKRAEDNIDQSEESERHSLDKRAEGEAKQFILFWDFATGATQYRWRLRGAHGETLALSQRSYASKPDCEADMGSVKMKHPDVPVVDLTKSL